MKKYELKNLFEFKSGTKFIVNNNKSHIVEIKEDVEDNSKLIYCTWLNDFALISEAWFKHSYTMYLEKDYNVEIKSVVGDYGIFINDKLQEGMIFSYRSNAEKVKEILIEEYEESLARRI
ncbi:MAG: hypothetical protein KH415_21715 [Clostridium sp.]|jgi:hypothetical protein|uniref:Uncharacterized protein n=1 Tax=Clostridium tertium TaxID=1559 RepID=A0A9X3XNJ8_9CLOT|nr:hypothetical protein [Clostridium tertium]MBS6504187.1 hypothetical protein [Clostridium sp.]MDC4242625.1 hypothetical protein [Clostridium tertium]